MLRIGILASTNATDMQAVIEAINSKKLNAVISVVVSNKKDSYALQRAKNHNIKAAFIDIADFSEIKDKEKQRESFDREVSKILDESKVELILLIGYMRVLSPWFVRKYKNRIMNIHPSLLPAFAGGMDMDVHAEVLKAGCRTTGCTLHFVEESVDGGPIIMQKTVDIEPNENVDSLKAKVQSAEQEIIVRAIKLFGEGKIKVVDRQVIIA